jgi:hypothetical protein
VNYLAYSHICAGMYEHAQETCDAELRRTILEIPIRLAGRDHTLYFVGTHWFDLKTVLGGDEAP